MSGQDLSKVLITSQTCVDSIVVDFEDIAYLDEFVTVPFQDRQTMPNTEGPQLPIQETCPNVEYLEQVRHTHLTSRSRTAVSSPDNGPIILVR